VGGRFEGSVERPKAVSEFLVERMILGGADKICFVISPGKADILSYYAGRFESVTFTYVVQQRPAGLCDAIFRAAPLVALDEQVLIGLPDTIWFPDDAFLALDDGALSFLLFPVEHPEFFDAVLLRGESEVQEIQVKQAGAQSNWIWGAFKMPGRVLHELRELWCERDQRDEYVGTLVNAYLDRGGRALGVRAGQAYVDVGTLAGFRDAIRILCEQNGEASATDGDLVARGSRRAPMT